jgi:hypothetical protein
MLFKASFKSEAAQLKNFKGQCYNILVTDFQSSLALNLVDNSIFGLMEVCVVVFEDFTSS